MKNNTVVFQNLIKKYKIPNTVPKKVVEFY